MSQKANCKTSTCPVTTCKLTLCWPVVFVFTYNNTGSSIGQRPIRDVSVPCNPAHISSAPVDVIRMVVKGVLESCGWVQHVASNCMQHPFRLACWATATSCDYTVPHLSINKKELKMGDQYVGCKKYSSMSRSRLRWKWIIHFGMDLM